MKPQLYIIRGPDGHPEAIHQRTNTPDGKRLAWWSLGPDGTPTSSLNGRAVTSLPLFGSQHAAGWDTSRPVFIVEGEADTMALAKAGYRALGTVTGAATCPGPEAFSLLRGHRVLLWPDHDQAGIEHMMRVARVVEPIAASVHWLDWPDAPRGGGAADYLAAGLSVDDLMVTAVRVPVPPASAKPRRYIAPPRRSSDVTDALAELYGLTVTPGRSVKCPMHDDRSPSLTIFADNKRALCHSATCAWNNGGHGVSAWEIRHPEVAS